MIYYHYRLIFLFSLFSLNNYDLVLLSLEKLLCYAHYIDMKLLYFLVIELYRYCF